MIFCIAFEVFSKSLITINALIPRHTDQATEGKVNCTIKHKIELKSNHVQPLSIKFRDPVCEIYGVSTAPCHLAEITKADILNQSRNCLNKGCSYEAAKIEN
jgi:hypothetical protein